MHDFASENPQNIYYNKSDSEWIGFINFIKLSIENIAINQYPFAKLNTDHSISIILHKCSDESCDDCNKTEAIEKTIYKEFIQEQLEFNCTRLELPLIDNQKKLIIKIAHPDSETIEYKFNITPYNFDSILKINPYYVYSRENSLLRLVNKGVNLKPGVIYLFPVLPINDQEYMIRAAGCQLVEMPGVQLAQIIPDEKYEEKYFHWTPANFREKLTIDGQELGAILSNILKSEGMLKDNEQFVVQNTDGFNLVLKPYAGNSLIKFVDLDANAIAFYSTYGNCSREDLHDCKSAEIKTIDFLRYLKEFLVKKFLRYKKNKFSIYSDNEILSVKNALDLVDKMVENEKSKSIEFQKTQSITAEKHYFNRDLNYFQGSMIVLGGTKIELELYNKHFSELGNASISDQIYTVNNDPTAEADMVADIGSLSAMSALSDNKFDVVCLVNAPNTLLNLQNALYTAHRILKTDGVLLFIRHIAVKKNKFEDNMSFFWHKPNIKLKDFRRSGLDTLGMMKMIGFKQSKHLISHHSQITESTFLAAKSYNQVDLNQIFIKIPAFKIFLKESGYKPDMLSQQFMGKKISGNVKIRLINMDPHNPIKKQINMQLHQLACQHKLIFMSEDNEGKSNQHPFIVPLENPHICLLGHAVRRIHLLENFKKITALKVTNAIEKSDIAFLKGYAYITLSAIRAVNKNRKLFNDFMEKLQLILKDKEKYELFIRYTSENDQLFSCFLPVLRSIIDLSNKILISETFSLDQVIQLEDYLITIKGEMHIILKAFCCTMIDCLSEEFYEYNFEFNQLYNILMQEIPFDLKTANQFYVYMRNVFIAKSINQLAENETAPLIVATLVPYQLTDHDQMDIRSVKTLLEKDYGFTDVEIFDTPEEIDMDSDICPLTRGTSIGCI